MLLHKDNLLLPMLEETLRQKKPAANSKNKGGEK